MFCLSYHSVYFLSVAVETAIQNDTILAEANDIIASLRGNGTTTNGMRAMELHCTLAMRLAVKQTTSPCGITKVYCTR